MAGYTTEWANQYPQGRANLCNAILAGAKLNEANLVGAELNKANLVGAKLNKAQLNWAKLNEADLRGTELNGAILIGAELNEANLAGAKLKANANLAGAKLKANANLAGAKLNKANLAGAELNEANLGGVELKDATLSYADLTGAFYAPASPPPAGYVAGIKGLKTVIFPPGQETGLVQLRKLLQDAGLSDLERQATYAIEHGRTEDAIKNWDLAPARAAEGVFRLVAFDLTTAYGLHPARALLLLLTSIGVFGVIYAVALMRSGGSIYRVRPQGRLQREFGTAKLVGEAGVEPLLPWGFPAALGRGLQFSLLSAFTIGWSWLDVGSWIARVQPEEYTLRAIGWPRVIAGLQSLLSVYLLAIWALTYFGRPFQ